MPTPDQQPPDPPIRVDWLDARLLADNLPGGLGLTILPGKRGASVRYPGLVYRRDLRDDLRGLRALGVEYLLLLVEDHELARWGDPAIIQRGAEVGIQVSRHPIPDGDAPLSFAAVDVMLTEIRRARERGAVAVACMGGVGRTGTVAACALVAAGLTPEAAIGHDRVVRHPEAVETAAQEAFVRAFAAAHQAGRRSAGPD